MSRSPSPVAFRRMQAGFVPAAQRERCATCAHVRVSKVAPDMQITEHSCDAVGFTTAWAWCKRWTRKVPPP